MFGNLDLLNLLVRIPAILIALSIHEFSHGFMAYKLGDTTAKRDGRLSLNPLRHIDPVGLICLILFRFGWAKPVMVNPNSFKNPKMDMALTSVAGPFSNFILAFVTLLIFYPLQYFFDGGQIMNIISMFLIECFFINIALGIFNMIPLPPLDGSKIFGALLPDNLYGKFIGEGSRFGTVILLILIWTGTISKIIGPLLELAYQFYFRLIDKIYYFL